MDLRIVVGIVIGLVAAYALLLALLWVLRPRDVGLREVIGGIASRNAMTPSRIPNDPTEAGSSRRERSTRSTPPA